MKNKWSSFSSPNCWGETNGWQCPYAIKDANGEISGFEVWENDYYSRSIINKDTLSRSHVLFLGDSFIFGHGIKRNESVSAHFDNIDSLEDYSCFNLSKPGGSNAFSLTRLQQWCNVHGEKLHTVYLGVTDIARTMHWDLEEDWTWDDNMHERTDSLHFNYVPSSPPENLPGHKGKSLQKGYTKIISKIDYVAKFETFLMSVINLSKVHGFNIFLFDTIPGITTREEMNTIKSCTEPNIRWAVDVSLSTNDTSAHIPNDHHWNSLGSKITSENLYNETKDWYVK